MNFVLRSMLALPLLTALGVPAQAQDAEVGTALICDTRQQVERYVSIYEGDAQSAVNGVNAAEHNPTACGMVAAVFVRGRKIADLRHNEKSFQIVPILILGIVTEGGIESITPAPFYSGFEINEIGA